MKRLFPATITLLLLASPVLAQEGDAAKREAQRILDERAQKTQVQREARRRAAQERAQERERKLQEQERVKAQRAQEARERRAAQEARAAEQKRLQEERARQERAANQERVQQERDAQRAERIQQERDRRTGERIEDAREDANAKRDQRIQDARDAAREADAAPGQARVDGQETRGVPAEANTARARAEVIRKRIQLERGMSQLFVDHESKLSRLERLEQVYTESGDRERLTRVNALQERQRAFFNKTISRYEEALGAERFAHVRDRLSIRRASDAARGR